MSETCVKQYRLRFASLFLLLGFIATGLAQTSAQADDSSWFAQWPQREEQLQAYQQTAPAELDDAAKIATISWLEKDADYASKHFRNTGEGLGEAYGEYYVDLALFVAGLKDARSINALTKVMDVAGRISTTLAEFGDAAVQPVIAQLDSPTLRSDAIFTLGKFVQGSRNGRSPVSPANVQTIRQLLLKFARDPSPLARESAAEALQYFKNDSEVVRTLQDLADNDPYSRGKDLKTNTAMFPVRRAAKAALTEATK